MTTGWGKDHGKDLDHSGVRMSTPSFVKRYLNLVAPLIILGSPDLVACADSARPVQLWKPSPSETFAVQVEIAGQPSFVTLVVPAESEAVKGMAVRQITFTPSPKAPAQVQHRCRLLLDLKTGQTIRAYRIPDMQEIKMETDGPVSFITGAPEGMPLEWFASLEEPQEKGELSPNTRRMTIRKEEEGEFVTMEMALSDKGVEELKICQKWRAGEKWWREYERYVKGEKNLTARWMNPPPMKKELATKQKLTDLAAKQTELVKKFPLRVNPKLQVRMNVVAKNPPISQILDEVRAATELELALAENLIHHAPDLGDIQMVNAPAFSFMEMLESRDLDNGHWEKIDGGYRLEGISKRLRPPPRGFPWLTVGAGTLALVVLAGGLYWRRLRKLKGPATA